MVKIHYIILNGEGGCGKTTFSQMVIKNLMQFGKYKYRASIKSSIDIVKQIAKQVRWDGNKDEAGRKLLHGLKVAMEEYNSYPTLWVMAESEKEAEEITDVNVGDLFVFVDIREPEYIKNFVEIAKYRGYDVVTIWMNRKGSGDNEVKELKETMRDYDYDLEIDNNGSMEQLEEDSKNFLRAVYGISEYNCPDCKRDRECIGCEKIKVSKSYKKMLDAIKGGKK